MAEKGRRVRKSYGKVSTFELGLKRRVTEGWAGRAEHGHGGGGQGRWAFLGRKYSSPLPVNGNRPQHPQ